MRRLCLMLGICLFASYSFAAKPALLTGMRVVGGPVHSFVTFNLDQKTYGRVKYFPQTTQLVIEFSNTTLGFRFKDIVLNNANVIAVRAEKNSPNNIKFSFELTQQVSFKVHFLPTKKPHFAQLQLEVIAKKIPPTNENTAQLQSIFNAEVLDTYEKITGLPPKPPKEPRIFTLVIDPGHGGSDPGAKGRRGVEEKKVVLAIATFLAQEINATPNMRAVLTRKGDYFVPLRGRLQLARKGDADLFVAVHADAYFDDAATGASVYALSNHGATTEAARWLAQRDKYPELDDVALNSLQDHSLELRKVLIDLAQTATIRDSLRLGNKMLDALDDLSPLHFNRVQQAPFVVLKSPDIPSVLIETGFITNPKEEKRLKNPFYQKRLAHALFQGIDKYIRTYAIFERS